MPRSAWTAHDRLFYSSRRVNVTVPFYKRLDTLRVSQILYAAETNCGAAVQSGIYEQHLLMGCTGLRPGSCIPQAGLRRQAPVGTGLENRVAYVAIVAFALRPLPYVPRHVQAAPRTGTVWVGAHRGRVGGVAIAAALRALLPPGPGAAIRSLGSIMPQPRWFPHARGLDGPDAPH